MLVVLPLIVLKIFNAYCKGETLPEINEINVLLKTIHDTNGMITDLDKQESNLLACINKILNNYFRDEKSLTFVDMKFDDEIILKSINLMNNFSIVNGIARVKVKFRSLRYFLTANDLKAFVEYFPNLTKVRGWNPRARFLIAFKLLEAHELKDVLDMLLKYHVINILIANGTTHPDLYTYNPFENYACGKYYTRIIHFGKCAENIYNLYPEKLATGLRNCTFNVSAPHWPPFSIDPTKREKGMTSQGVEQYVMETIAKMEHFKINFTYNFDAEIFSPVSSDLFVSGPMEMLQNNKTDVMLGGLLLYRSRATAFSYLYGHLDHADDIKIVVKKAPLMATWVLFYLEFEPLVWLCLFLSLVVFSVLFIILLQAQDRSIVVLKLLDTLLLHGYKIHSRLVVKCIFIIWLWFTFLINCFYQSNLMSLTTTPTPDWQISETQNLIEYGVKPCVSPIMFNFIDPYRNGSGNVYNARASSGCKKLVKSMETVSNSKYLYTIVPNSIYLYNKNLFYDKWGQPLLYSFQKPISNAVYAIYLYKGFPMQYRIHKLTLMLKENGLVQRHIEEQYYLRDLQYHYQDKGFEVRFVLPWYLYGFGCFVSIVALVVECSSKM